MLNPIDKSPWSGGDSGSWGSHIFSGAAPLLGPLAMLMGGGQATGSTSSSTSMMGGDTGMDGLLAQLFMQNQNQGQGQQSPYIGGQGLI